MKKIISILLCLAMLLVCAACADCTEHHFGVWEYRRAGLHKGICVNEDCGFIHYVPCTEMAGETDSGSFTVCPVCGHSGDGDGTFLMGITADLFGYNAAPIGEFCVYRYDDPMGDGSVKAAFSVIFERAGLIEAYDGGFRINIPTALEGEFTLYNGKGEEIACEYENGILSFTSNEGCGIYFVK